ncbi:ABC transporter ATP-binding protein [Rhodoplanes sp. Z2-YC6860]|uniref:ABC transporter ATP-binding protein n=1 Tax=Rhodoplanes sp. Z2-YC6860 TaxID=674703 RepID=UPI00078EED4E|nr:ABC transporter ATP-binding protein [Rhodoplanes sp. Z2-YC6860]AMN40618.1 ABC transporter ATP-binding protein [Rhodoplanes sp. Z2-YC6860]
MPPAGVPAQLEVEIAHKAFGAALGGRRDVLAGFKLRLGYGEVGALLGPSGCGKTTVLRIIAGLDADYDGTVRLPHHGRLGMMFQEPRLLPWRTVENNVRLAAPEASDAALDALFASLGLATHRNNFPGELSLGLARRVAMARAFAVEPDLLLLDEPFVSLDSALAAQLVQALADLVSRNPVTALLVTHDIDEAINLADRVFLLSASPCRVVAEVPITKPRSKRSTSEVAAVREEIQQRLHQAGAG